MAIDSAQYALVVRQNTAPELTVLRQILATGTIDPAVLAQARGPLLVDVARLNKLTGFLMPHRAQIQGLFPEVIQLLDYRRLETMGMNRRCLALGAEVQARFAAAGVRHLHLKGVLQQVSLYGDAYRKPTSDVDLLIDRRDFRLGERLLTEAGMVCEAGLLAPWWRIFLGEQHYQRTNVVASGGNIVDLHHKLQQPGSPGVWRAAEFIKRAVPQEFEGNVYAVPSAIDRCLIAAISVVKAAYGREAAGGYVADLAAALGILTPAELAALPDRAGAHGLRETLDFATSCLDAILVPFGAPVRRTGPNPLASIDDERLSRMVMEPWAPDLVWPRRREVLRALCGSSILRYGVEVCRAAVSEGYVRILLALQAKSRAGQSPTN